MNYNIFIVKIIKEPKQIIFDNTISLIKIPGIFYTARKNEYYNFINLSIWGNLTDYKLESYKKNDYIIVEGYISLYTPIENKSKLLKDKQIELSVFKILPF